jgi:nitroreductase
MAPTLPGTAWVPESSHAAEGGALAARSAGEGGPAGRIRDLLRFALLAPSRHNAQPWIFEIEGDELRVYPDPSRALPAADPDGRQLVMSCGAAVVNFRVAAAHHGFRTSVEVSPSHRRDGLLARVRLEERAATSEPVEELFEAIARRRTNRLPLDGREPPPGLVTALLREARSEGASLRPVEPHQRLAVAELVAEGDRQQWSDARFRAELARWTRPSGTHRRDGMPGFALGLSTAAALVQPVLARLANPARAEADRDRRRALGTRALIVLSTRGDGEREWFAAGEALQRVLLRATARGLSASYFAQPIETPTLRGALREALGERGKPQVMLRIGYGREVPALPRRSVDDVLRSVAPRLGRSEGLALWRPSDGRPAVGLQAPGSGLQQKLGAPPPL